MTLDTGITTNMCLSRPDGKYDIIELALQLALQDTHQVNVAIAVSPDWTRVESIYTPKLQWVVTSATVATFMPVKGTRL